MASMMILAAVLQAATPTMPAPVSTTAPAAMPAGTPDGAARRFARMDSDKDGVVTKAEADALMARRGGGGAGGDGQAPRGGGWFARADADGDGKVTRAEADTMTAARAGRPGGRRGAEQSMTPTE